MTMQVNNMGLSSICHIRTHHASVGYLWDFVGYAWDSVGL